MARKKKKQNRKERIKQRRANLSRKRKGVSRNKAGPRPKSLEQELVDDMLPLFPRLRDDEPSPADMQQLMMSVLDSDHLADEPEFNEIIFDPMLSANTFVEVGQELGVGPNAIEKLDELSDEERDDKLFEMLEQTTERLFTEESYQDILARLNKLRLRLKRSGKRKKVPKVAALQSFLSGEQGRALWPMVGLIHTLVDRSINAGFELTAATAEFVETAGIGELDSISSMSERLEESTLGQKVTSVVKKIPGMRRLLENKVDQLWDEGMKALYSGELHLGLYLDEELDAAAEIMKTIFGSDSDEADEKIDEGESRLTEENVQTFAARY